MTHLVRVQLQDVRTLYTRYHWHWPHHTGTPREPSYGSIAWTRRYQFAAYPPSGTKSLAHCSAVLLSSFLSSPFPALPLPVSTYSVLMYNCPTHSRWRCWRQHRSAIPVWTCGIMVCAYRSTTSMNFSHDKSSLAVQVAEFDWRCRTPYRCAHPLLSYNLWTWHIPKAWRTSLWLSPTAVPQRKWEIFIRHITST